MCLTYLVNIVIKLTHRVKKIEFAKPIKSRKNLHKLLLYDLLLFYELIIALEWTGVN